MVKRENRRDVAEEFLRLVLADGPLLASEVKAMAEETGAIAPATLRRARDSAGIIVRKSREVNGAWSWELPKS